MTLLTLLTLPTVVTVLTLLSAISAGAAAAAGMPPSAAAVLNRLREIPSLPARFRPRPGLRAFAPHAVLLVIACCVLGVAVRSPVLALVGIATAGAVMRFRRRRQTREAAAVRRAAVVELCTGLAAELRAGRTPREALIRAAAGPGSVATLCPAAVSAAASGADVPAALITASREGAGPLRWLAACWQVAEEQGAGLAAAAERLADHSRANESLRQEVSTQLAGPRATAVLLAVLPGVGVLCGTGLGAAPLDVLLRTPWGLACFVLGGLLAAAGVAWTGRIARTAEEAA
jgi:tight adherence protein B